MGNCLEVHPRIRNREYYDALTLTLTPTRVTGG